MEKDQAEKRIKILREQIEKYRYDYHVLDKLDIPEQVLDSLKHELFQLEQEYPEFISSDSPTQRVAGKPLDKFEKVTHTIPMISLEDIFSKEELFDWQERNQKILPNEEFSYFAETKVDGVAVSLIYENGIFTKGSTRGDGRTGEDVTFNLKTVQSIPLTLKGNNIPNLVEVRGEVYMPTAAFDKLNEIRMKEELQIFANPRNATAGSIRQLDPVVAASRNLECFAYTIVQGYGDLENHSELHQLLREWGFKLSKFEKKCSGLEEVISFWQEIEKKKKSLPFWIDGIVVCIDSLSLQERLGVVGKTPRSSIAFKFSPEKATSVVEEITIQVGRTGILTPVAELKPVQIDGTLVRRATLHNMDEIERKDIRVGDTVVVHKAGEIIPEVVEVLLNFRDEKSKKFEMLEECPVCGSQVAKKEDEVYYRCFNKNCFAQQKEAFLHFISRSGFNIEGIGPSLVDQLLDRNLVKDPADLFFLEPSDFQNLELFASKKAYNTYKSIQKNKKVTLLHFINSLGILNVGIETADLLLPLILNKVDAGRVVDGITENNSRGQLALFADSKRETSHLEGQVFTPISVFEAARKVSKEELLNVLGIGEQIAVSFITYFEDHKTKELFEKLAKAGIEIFHQNKKVFTNPKVLGKSFIFTGSLEKYTREEAKNLVRQNGGKIVSAISKDTDFVVVGTDPGSKYDKAKKMNLSIIDEKEFSKLFNS